MKKLLIISFLFFTLQNYAFSQGIEMIKNNQLTLTFGPTWTNWAEYPDTIKMKPARNIGFDFAFLYAMKSKNEKFGFQFGLGMSMINLHTNIYPLGFDEQGAFNHYLKTDDYKTNKLALTYLELPVELVLKPGKDSASKNTFSLALGFKGGWTIDSHTKLKTDDGTIYKIKSFNNINRFRYGPTVRMGIGKFHLFGFYSLASTFEGEKIPDYNQYTIGLFFSNF